MFNIWVNDSISQFNLEQGKEMLNYNDDMDKITGPDLKLIQSGMLEGLNGLGGMETEPSNMSSNDKLALEGLQNIENNFNQTLALYTQTYNQMNEDIISKRQSSQKTVDYLGKVVSDVDGNNYYVNQFGFTHKYSPNAWENNNSSCPSTNVVYSGSMYDFQTSLPMIQGQPCKIAGQNIKNKDTKEEAWVDIKGIKHPYSNSNAEKNTNCSSKSIELSGRDYNLIPTGGAMSSSDSCLALDVNPQLWSRIQELNAKLKQLAVQLTQEIHTISLEDRKIKEQLMYRRQELLNYIDMIDNNKHDIMNNNSIILQANGEMMDSSLRMTSNYYSYIIWVFLMIFIIMLTISSSNSVNGNISGISYVIVALLGLIFLLYLCTNW